MIEIVKPDINIDFTSKFKVSSVISIIVVVIALYGLLSRMEYGVDFRGGAEIQAKFDSPVSLDLMRTKLEKAGFSGVSAQTIGEFSDNEILLKVAANEENLNEVTQKVRSTLMKVFEDKKPDIRKIDIVGPKAGAALRVSGFQAMLWAILAIMIYIGLRFDFKYAPGAIVALFHDVVIILGIFAFTNTEFTLQTVAALLAVIGYSVNDTVIVYDRVREHEERDRELPLIKHINSAINSTLSRTVLTSGTTLFVSLSMFFFGGQAIKDFFFAITLGIIIGTYSSIFVASPVTLFFNKVNAKA
ncbi:MAG: protein translocase subunit SecF [Bdellovibrionales bacterium]|nr:protein translocase subunit SecF [Bdellovibrionales bacterium]